MVKLVASPELSAAETAALTLSLAHLGSGPQAGTARRALRRIFPVAPLDDTAAERAKVIATAISERQVVRLLYADADGRVTSRRVEPVTCMVHRDHWYLVGWCQLRRGVRAFRIDRLLAVEATAQPARAHRAERFLPFQPRARRQSSPV